MASSLPNDFFGTAFQRFAYNIDLIEKRYANKRPSGLELDIDTGKIIQVNNAKRPRLTAEEAKEKLKTSLLAPQSLLGNSSLCSPFINDMNASRETKLRVLKHNKRFKLQLKNGINCATFLAEENDNDTFAAANDEEEGDDKGGAEEELFDMSDILDDDVEYDDNDQEQEEGGVEKELSEDEEDLGPSDEHELEAELEKQKENEEDLPFEEPEEEASNEENTYKNVKITRALVQRLTPKVVREPKKAASTESKNVIPAGGEETPKTTRGRKSLVAAKEQNQDIQSTPKVPKKITTKALSAEAISKTTTPTVSKDKKVPKASSEKAVTRKDVALLSGKIPKKTSSGRICIPTKNVVDFVY